jgi:hypothetical protein
MGRPFIWFVPVFVILLLISESCRRLPESGGALQVEAAVDTNVVTIGDLLTYRVLVQGGDERRLRFPDWEGDLPFEIRARQPVEPEKDLRGVQYQLVFWDTGHYVIPPYQVQILKADSTVDYTLITDSLPVTVASVLAGTDTPTLRPIKGPVPIRKPVPWRTLALGAAALLLVAGLVYFWKRRLPPEKRTELHWTPTRPPDEVALEALQELQQHPPGEVKEYYVRLSHILRAYVEHSFFIKALEMTTEEIRAHRELFPFSDGTWEEWLTVLTRADVTKYARHVPSPELQRQDLDWAFRFVRDTTADWKDTVEEAVPRLETS